MDDEKVTLPLTVHLLASSGSTLSIQQAVDQLLHRVCPDIQLFLVSERPALTNTVESPRKRIGFPGISVTLFLRDDLGQERVSVLRGFLQLHPWNRVHIESKQVRTCAFSQSTADYYCLDLHMPVWGIRQVHYGMEIVRLTLYCSFDNYEDAVRLYEMILRMEAITEKPGFCFFTLYSTKYTSVQFSLKQLPPGISVQVKDRCALQFGVQAIGQLVPLLPYPCMPISDTRWQTQDYEGNKILFMVITCISALQNFKLSKSLPNLERSPWVCHLCREHHISSVTENTVANLGHRDSRMARVSHVTPSARQKTFMGRLQKMGHERLPVSEEVKFKQVFNLACNISDQNEKTCDQSENDLQKPVPRHSVQLKETETNVDTGCTVIKLREQPIFDHNFTGLQDFFDGRHFCTTGEKEPLDMFSKPHGSLSPMSVKSNTECGLGTQCIKLERSKVDDSNYRVQKEEFFI
ncbi:protein FAM124B [Spea bombifrons]|uniref:protein FAM124B n=1 Tax=Spea bombifrons TaxID=233779 RepID=UPI002349972A|nr:protein FAM124B [Spea bombifrons]